MRSLASKLSVHMLLAASLCPASLAWAADFDKVERHQRQVDRAALASQDQAIRTLETLAKKQVGGEREFLFLSKIVEAHQLAAKIEFRLSHGSIEDDGVNKTVPPEYRRRLQNVINAASNATQKFPDEEGVEAAYYARAEAYREMGDKPSAEKDYLLISSKFPRSSWAEKANLALGDFAAQAGDYAKAIEILRKVEAERTDQYPFVLHQIAWAYFNLNDIPSAISYLQRRQAFYVFKESQAPEKKLSSPDYALQEQGLRDIAAFYFSAYDKGDPKYPLTGALDTFRSVEPGAYLGKMLVHLASLLKGRDRWEGLGQWVTLLTEKASDLPETLDAANVLLEYAADKGLFDKGPVHFLADLDKKTSGQIRSLPNYTKSMNLILQGSGGLQERVGKERDQTKVASLRRALIENYDAFLKLAPEGNPGLAGVHYNRGEILLAQEDYEAASTEYQWLLENGPGSLSLDKSVFSFKAVVAGFRGLLKKNLIPKELSLGKPQGESSPDYDALPAGLGGWVASVAKHVSRFGREPEGFEEFEYEAYRILYVNGQTRAAIAGIRKMVKERSKASVALPAAKIALDTCLSGNDLPTARTLAEDWGKLPAFGDEPFRKRLSELSAEIDLRAGEEAADAGDFAKAGALSQQWFARYKDSSWAPQALLLASRISLGKHDVAGARRQLTELVSRHPASDSRPGALRLKAGLAESVLDFDEAASDWRELLSLSPKGTSDERAKIARRYFLSSWLSLHPKALDCEPFKDAPALALECDRYRGLIALIAGGVLLKDALRNLSTAPEENRGIWGAVALKSGDEKMELKDRLAAAKALAVRWKQLDPLIQFALLPELNRTLPESFRAIQRNLPRMAPLKADSKSLVRRIGLIKDVEASVEQIVDLPWAQVKVHMLSSVAQIYLDFCDELAKLPKPKGLAGAELAQYEASVSEILVPFRAKQEAIGGQVKSLAAQFPVDPYGLAGVKNAEPRQLASEGSDLELSRSLFEPENVQAETPEAKGEREKLAGIWEGGLKGGHWGRLAYHLQDLKEKRKLKDASLAVLRALALGRAGAKAEALAELESAAGGLGAAPKRAAERLMAAWYESSTVPEKAKAHAEAGVAPPPPAPIGGTKP